MLEWNLNYETPDRPTQFTSDDGNSFPFAGSDEISRRNGGKPLANPGSSAFRSARLRAVREAIQLGEFETEDRIRGTVDRLLEILEITPENSTLGAEVDLFP